MFKSVAFCFVSIRESRYLLVLTENYAALPIVQQELLKKGDDPVVIFGSSFPKDQEYTQVPTSIICSNSLFVAQKDPLNWVNTNNALVVPR